MISFFKTAIESPTPIRRSTCGPVDLVLPHSISLLPQHRVQVDLLNGVRFPVGVTGIVRLKQRVVRNGERLLLHADFLGRRNSL